MSKVIYFRGMKEKLEAIVKNFPQFFGGKVLDVGCGRRDLEQLITGDYLGIDRGGLADIKLDVNKGLSFGDKSFDTVAAFDVLEHLDNLHLVFDELCRVSKQWVIITLPNMYEWRFRFYFLFGKALDSYYYGLSANDHEGRHRWLFSLNEARDFARKRAATHNFEVYLEELLVYRYNKILPRIIVKIGLLFGEKFQNLFVDHYLVVLKRKEK